MPSATDPAGFLLVRDARTAQPVAMRGEGVWLYDRDGRAYLDACGGALVVTLGHGRHEIAEAGARQSRSLAFVHTSEFLNEPALELAAALAALVPQVGKVFFASSGSEVIEAAMKLARQYHVERGEPQRRTFISRIPSYHGATLGALSLSGYFDRRDLFAPLLPPVRFVPAPVPYRRPPGQSEEAYGLACAQALEAAIRAEGPETVAAFIVEPVIGASASGAVPPPGYFPAVREICDRYGVLLIADEVMTGMGRTGRSFALEHWNVIPDMTAVGKGLTSGYAPLAALLIRDRVYDAIADGSGRFIHGHTFSAHPASCAVGLAVLRDLHERGLIAAAAERGRHLRARLVEVAARHAVIGDVRGLGLMVGVEFVVDRETRAPFPREMEVAPRIVQACMARGLLVYPGRAAAEGRQGDHLLFGPPYCITPAELDEAVARFDDALEEVEPALLGASDSRTRSGGVQPT